MDAAAQWLRQQKNKSSKKKPAKKRQYKVVKRVRNFYLYALLLEDDKYYVGLTSYKDALQRYQQHVDGKGATWTKMHKPLQILETRNIGVCGTDVACMLENKMTREYMEKYGMYNVRGGDLCYVSPKSIASHYNDSIEVKSVRRAKKHETQEAKVQQGIVSELSWIRYGLN